MPVAVVSDGGWRVFLGRRPWFPVLTLAAGLALRLWFIHGHDQIQGDSLVYGDIAANWLRHGIYGHTVHSAAGPSTVEPTLVRLPGYPAFLALCFAMFGPAQYHAVLVVQSIVDLGSCLLIARLASTIRGPAAGGIALLLAALCPFTANYAATPLTETLSIFCVALGFCALAEVLARPGVGWIGLLVFSWSYAALLRPDGALLAVVLCGAVVIYGRRTMGWAEALRLGIAAALVSVLPFVAWTVRNARTFHVFQPLAPRFANDPGEFAAPGFVQWVKTFAVDFTSTSEIYWNGNSDDIEVRNLPARAFDNLGQYNQTHRLIDAYNVDTTLTPALDGVFAGIAQDRIRAHPFRYYVTLPLLRLADMWFRPRVEMMNMSLRWWQFRQHRKETSVAVFLGFLNLCYLIAAGVGAWRRPPLIGAMVAFLAVRCSLLATLEAPEPRYTLECFPVVIVLAAIALVGLAEAKGLGVGFASPTLRKKREGWGTL